MDHATRVGRHRDTYPESPGLPHALGNPKKVRTDVARQRRTRTRIALHILDTSVSVARTAGNELHLWPLARRTRRRARDADDSLLSPCLFG